MGSDVALSDVAPFLFVKSALAPSWLVIAGHASDRSGLTEANRHHECANEITLLDRGCSGLAFRCVSRSFNVDLSLSLSLSLSFSRGCVGAFLTRECDLTRIEGGSRPPVSRFSRARCRFAREFREPRPRGRSSASETCAVMGMVV